MYEVWVKKTFQMEGKVEFVTLTKSFPISMYFSKIVLLRLDDDEHLIICSR